MWKTLIDIITHPAVASALAAGVTFVGHKLVGAAKWAGIRRAAHAMLADPNQTDDARAAVEAALIQAQLDRVAEAAKRVEQAFVVNGSNPYPKGK